MDRADIILSEQIEETAGNGKIGEASDELAIL